MYAFIYFSKDNKLNQSIPWDIKCVILSENFNIFVTDTDIKKQMDSKINIIFNNDNIYWITTVEKSHSVRWKNLLLWNVALISFVSLESLCHLCLKRLCQCLHFDFNDWAGKSKFNLLYSKPRYDTPCVAVPWMKILKEKMHVVSTSKSIFTRILTRLSLFLKVGNAAI